MAALARNIRVRAIEHEIGLLVVIKAPLGPVDRVVAGRTGLAEAPIVRIVFAMTVCTCHRRVTENM